MAESIAKETFTKDINISSCGINVTSNKLNKNAVQVIYEKLKIDLKEKETKKISSVALKIFDTIYSLDEEVSKYLRQSTEVKGSIVEILVADPYNQHLDKYYDTFNEIYSKLKTIENEQGSI